MSLSLWGKHALFMSYLYRRRYGEDDFFIENRWESQGVQAEFLKKEGVAYKSSMSEKVSASKGSLSEGRGGCPSSEWLYHRVHLAAGLPLFIKTAVMAVFVEVRGYVPITLTRNVTHLNRS